MSLCVAVDFYGNIDVSTDPTGGAGAWRKSPVFPSTGNTFGAPSQGTAISCVGGSFCVAVAHGDTCVTGCQAGPGYVKTTTDPTGGPSAWSVTSPASMSQPDGVSCPSTTLCLEADFYGVNVSTDPNGNGAKWTATGVGVTGSAVSCASTRLCVTVTGDGQALATSDPTGGAARWNLAQLTPSVNDFALTGVSCVTGSLCVAVDDSGEAFVSTDPTLGKASWSGTKVDDTLTAELDGVSCPSVTLCVAVDQLGNVIVGTPSPPPPPAQIRKLLSHDLIPRRGRVTIKNLLRNHAYELPFSAPSAGRLQVDWYLTPPRTPAAKRAPKPVLIAAAHLAFATASDAKIRLALTREGATLLRAAKRVTVTAKAHSHRPARDR